jgi:hypothetical protein
MRLPILRGTARAALGAIALAVLAAGPGLASAASAKAAPAATVGIVTPAWAPRSGLNARVQVVLRAPVTRMTVGLLVTDATGHLVWSQYQSRRALQAFSYTFSFARPPNLGSLPAGVYTLRSKVRLSSGRSPADVVSTLVLADRGGASVPVALVVRVAGTPTRDPAGVFVVDPIDDGGSRAEAEALFQFSQRRPDLQIAGVVSPLLLSEWRDAADGYSFAAASGVTKVEAASDPAAAFRGTLEVIARARAQGMPTPRVMYADPDPAGLVAVNGVPLDVTGQLELGSTVTSAALSPSEAQPSEEATGLAVAGDVLPEALTEPLIAAGIRYALVDPASVTPSRPGTVAPGAYAVSRPSSRLSSQAATLTALVVDRQGSALLAAPTGGPALAARLFRLAAARATASQPVVLEVTVGPGGAHMADLLPTLAALGRLPWVRLVSVSAAATSLPAGVVSLVKAPTSDAPAGYWATLSRARSRTLAFVQAVGPQDPDAQAALLDGYAAESRGWAGPKGAWTLADRGLAFAAAADRLAESSLSQLTVEVPAVTLSSSSGKVPVSVENGSSKTLTVTVLASSPDIGLPKPEISARLRPGENILSVPVDLGPSLSSALTVRVMAGEVVLASRTTVVRASYLDRFVLLGGVVLVLLVLLGYIRRKSRQQPEDDA